MVGDELPHSREIESTLDHTEGSVYPPVTCDDGVVLRRNDFLDTVFRHHDFVVCPQASVFEALPLLIFELQGCWVEQVGENLGVLAIVFHPVVENGVGWGDEAANDIGDRDTGP